MCIVTCLNVRPAKIVQVIDIYLSIIKQVVCMGPGKYLNFSLDWHFPELKALEMVEGPGTPWNFVNSSNDDSLFWKCMFLVGSNVNNSKDNN